MTIAEMVLEKLRQLASDQQKVVLEFIDSLNQDKRTSESVAQDKALRTLEGLWGEFGIEITEEDITESRREMWSNFPREIF